MANKNFYHRVGHVEILLDDGVEINSGICDFKFKVTFPIAARRAQAEISILGLSMETIQSVLAYMPWNIEQARKRRVRLFAGYSEDGGEHLIFDGYIIQALPTNPPDMWLNIKADNIGFASADLTKKTPTGTRTRVIDVLDSLAKSYGWSLDRDYCNKHFGAGMKKQVSMPAFTGDASRDLQIANGLGEFCLDITTVGNGSESYSGVLRPYPTFQVDSLKSDAIEMSLKNGLVGIPQIQWTNITLTNFLTTEYSRGTWIRLKSEMIPKANGLYWVYEVTYQGQLREGDWFVIISARPDEAEAQARALA